ncbi:MAG: hypothetical protein V4482_02055 [Pseudomonadota bacterium]
MSYPRESRENKTKEELSDESNTLKIRKCIKNDKWILLRDIQKSLDLSADQTNSVLSKIMQDFWRGKHNLYSLPQYSDIFRDLNFHKYNLITLTKEMLRSLLSSELTGHNNRIKSRPDLITTQLNWNNGDDDFYETFYSLEWKDYQRIINRLKRNNSKVCKQREEKLAQLKDELEQSGAAIETTDDHAKLSDLASKIDHLTHDINIPMTSDYIKLYTLDALAMEINDFIHFMRSLVGGDNPLNILKRTIDSLDNIINSDKTRQGHQLDNDFIFCRYLEIQEAAMKVLGEQKKITEIAKEIYNIYFKGEESKINSCRSIENIIHRQIKIEVEKNVIIMRDRDNIMGSDIISTLSKWFYISPSYIEDMIATIGDESPHPVNLLWLEWDTSTNEFVHKNQNAPNEDIEDSMQNFQR